MVEKMEMLPPFEADGLRLNMGGGVEGGACHATIGAYTRTLGCRERGRYAGMLVKQQHAGQDEFVVA